MLFLFGFFVSLTITMVLIPPIMKWADKIGAIDLPDARKVHTTAIPRVGGIAMVIGSVLSIILWAEFDSQIISLLLGFLVLLFFGIWDDRSDLNYKIKFLGQIIAVLIVVIFGDVVLRIVPFVDELPDYIAIPFTVFALVGITNAINLSDGLDGLAGGTTLLSLCAIGLLALQADGVNVVLVCMAVAGSIFGFLRHNTYPARLFMGDTGSQFLGFSAGVLSILLTQNVNTAMSSVLPLIILGLPILDTVAVMSQRLYEGRSPFSPDKNHIHHKLLALGFDHYEAVMLIYIVQSVLVSAAYVLRYESDLLLLLSYFLFCFIVLLFFYTADREKWKFHKSDVVTESWLGNFVRKARNSGVLTAVPTLLLKVSVSLVLLAAVLLSDMVHVDLAILSAILLAVFVINILLSGDEVTIVEKAIVYIVCVMAVYLLLDVDEVQAQYSQILDYVFVFIAIAFALKVRFSVDKSFQVTPLDYLVVSLVIVVPNIPNMGFEEDHIGEMALRLIVLFYASEALLNIISGRWALIRLSILSVLAIVAVRGF